MLAPASVLPRDQEAHLLVDRLEGFGGGEAIRGSFGRAALDLQFESGDRGFKELVQIGTKMQKNLRRSSSGVEESKASIETRWLNASQLNSRLSRWPELMVHGFSDIALRMRGEV